MAGVPKSIFTQPPEIMEMIFSQLNTSSAKKAALVCPTFYEMVCSSRQKLPQILDVNEKGVDNFFQSIMKSKRRVNKIKIFIRDNEDKTMDRIGAILEKFKPTMKSLSFTSKSSNRYYEILWAASEVEHLLLVMAPGLLNKKRRCIRLDKFSKLKHLELGFVPDAQKILNAIPDDSLEKLDILEELVVTNKEMQAFINRQKKIKELYIDQDINVNFDHLSLEKLMIDTGATLWDEQLNALLNKQLDLRSLGVWNVGVSANTLTTIFALQGLKELKLSFALDEDNEDFVLSHVERLGNLQRLTSLTLVDSRHSGLMEWPGSPFLSRVSLPKLLTLELDISGDLGPQFFVVLSQNMRNLQKLKLFKCKSSDLRVIIGSCVNLKSLKITHLLARPDQDPNPYHQNESMEELITRSPAPIYNAIDACPNLKRLELTQADGPEAALLECIRRSVNLTHLRFTAIFHRSSVMINELGPSLSGIIELFRDSPAFTELKFVGIPRFSIRLVENLFGNRLAGVSIKIYDNGGLTNCLEVVKK